MIKQQILLLLTASAATVALGLGLTGCNATTADSRGGPPLVPVTLTESRRMTIPMIVNPIATARALQDVTIRARVKGFLTEKHFDEGGMVKKDQLLLVIDEKPFKIALEQAEAQLAASEAVLRKAVASKAAEVARAQLALDRAQLLLDEVEERRSRNLLVRKAASQEDYDKADAQRKKSEAQVQADQAKHEQSVADYQIDIDRAKADVAQARSAVADARLNLGYCQMSAPISGRIGELKVKLGNLVGESSPTELVTIQQLDPMGLDLLPAARYLPWATALLARGLEVHLSVEGERLHPYVGKAIFIDNHVDPTTSTFLVRAEVRNPEGSILPGQYIKATMTVGEYVDAVAVPEQAVVEGQEGSRVFVVDSQHKVQVAKVKPVDVYRGLRVLESGIEPGQKVIVKGIQLVRQGQSVESEEAPFDQFLRELIPVANADQRFNSPISRIPGMKPESQSSSEPKAQTKPQTPEKKKAR
jgi:membrane fusion protein (multidrug efflux system)